MPIGNYVCGNFHTDNGEGDCAMTTYPSNTTQGGGHSTGGGSGTSGSSHSSPEQHIQQVCTSLGGNVLGGAYHDGRKNRDSADGINYQIKGIVSQLNYYGFKDHKGIVLSDCDLRDIDMAVLVKTIQPFQWNLTEIDFSNNCQLGDKAVENLFYTMGTHQTPAKYVQRFNLSNCNIGDYGAEYIAQSLISGRYPATTSIDVSLNHITPTGYRFLSDGLAVINQDLKIVLEVAKGFSKDALKATMKKMLSIAHSNGISTKETLTTDETIQHCIKGGVNVGLNISWGVAKCTKTPLKYLSPKDLILQDVILDVASSVNVYAKGISTFICITEKIFFSVVDEDFANCLQGLVGVGGLLDE